MYSARRDWAYYGSPNRWIPDQMGQREKDKMCVCRSSMVFLVFLRIADLGRYTKRDLLFTLITLMFADIIILHEFQ